MTTMQRTALAAFSSARALFLKRRFDQPPRRMREYRRLIDYRGFPMIDQRGVQYPVCSVILVIHSATADIVTSIDTLLGQLGGRAEIIVVDNGGSEGLHDALASRPLMHVRCPYNLLPSEGRNIGTFFARSPMLVFMDDDGLPAEDYIEQAIAALAPPEVVGVRACGGERAHVHLMALQGRITTWATSQPTMPPSTWKATWPSSAACSAQWVASIR